MKVRLAIDWRALGLDPTNATLSAPAIADFQPAMTMAPADEIEIAPGKGFLLVLSPGLPRTGR